MKLLLPIRSLKRNCYYYYYNYNKALSLKYTPLEKLIPFRNNIKEEDHNKINSLLKANHITFNRNKFPKDFYFFPLQNETRVKLTKYKTYNEILENFQKLFNIPDEEIIIKYHPHHQEIPNFKKSKGYIITKENHYNIILHNNCKGVFGIDSDCLTTGVLLNRHCYSYRKDNLGQIHDGCFIKDILKKENLNKLYNNILEYKNNKYYDLLGNVIEDTLDYKRVTKRITNKYIHKYVEMIENKEMCI